MPQRPAIPCCKPFSAVAFLLILVCQPLAAQSAPGTAPLEPGLRPPDAPAAVKQLVGIYTRRDTREPYILFERDNRLYWQDAKKRTTDAREEGGSVWVDFGDGRVVGLGESRTPSGMVNGLASLHEFYDRTDAGSDPKNFYHVVPVRPLEEIRAEALRATPPAEAGPFREPDLVELERLDPAIHLDIRYAQSNNFLSSPSYTEARAFLERPAAEALLRALQKLKPLGYGFLVHDAYRPWYVTRIFWDATPAEGHDFVANPQKGSKHNRGCAVDITLYDLSTGKPIEMPGLYDEMSPRSFPAFPGGTSLERWHRDLLRRAIESEGFTVDGNEWWHFDYKDWKQYPILNVPFEKLGKG